MPNNCILVLAKNINNIAIFEMFTYFLKSWYGITNQFGESVLVCIQK